MASGQGKAMFHSSSSSSQNKMSYYYHVFLSFRGEDTRKTFTDHLYTALVNAGFRTFRDDDGIERGEDVTAELHNAIRNSKSSVIVFSKEYASSRWCLDELCIILECRRAGGHVVLPVFYNVDPSEVRKQTGSFATAFQRHGKKHNKVEVNKWKAALAEAGDLAGMVLQNQEDGYESKFIQNIVRVVGRKLHQPTVVLPPNLIGIHSRAENLNQWVQDRSSNISIAAVCGIGGIGKTTVAKFVYEMNKGYFDGHCFLEDVKDTSKRSNGLLLLQNKLLSDILKVEDGKITSVDEGILRIQDVLCYKRILLVLDGVDHIDQINAIFGMRDWFHLGSKIIITTRYEYLLRARESYNLHERQGQDFVKVYNVKLLDHDESSQLFCLYVFGRDYPIADYETETRRIVNYCGGLPLALIVLGRSLCGKSSVELWRSMADKLKEIPNNQVMEKLKISYESLEDDHDKKLFLHIVCFFIGKDKAKAVQRLDACEFYTVVGIENLIDRCLVSVDHQNRLRMHQLIRDMGREMIRLQSPEDPGNRCLLWYRKDSLEVLREKSGTRRIEGFILDMDVSKQNNSTSENSPQEDECNSITHHCNSEISENSVHQTSVEFEADAFTTMKRLKILYLKHVQLTGSYEAFSKSLRWLSWKGYSHESLSSSLSLDGMVALEMRHSSLKQLWTQHKVNGSSLLNLDTYIVNKIQNVKNLFLCGQFLGSLKILNLSHSHRLASTPDFSLLPNLERLVLKYCTELVEIHDSIGCLSKLGFLNLKECKNLEKLPDNILRLKFLETLDISGCLKIKQLADLRKLPSLKVLLADGLAMSEWLSPPSTLDASNSKEGAIINSSGIFIQPRQGPEISWAGCLPITLVSLSLANCSLSTDDFPRDLSHLSSLRNLTLSGNPFNSLPDFIKHLNIENLDLASCRNLEILEGLPRPKYVDIAYCTSLKKVAFIETKTTSYKTLRHNAGCPSLVDMEGDFKLEPLECVRVELIETLELNNCEIPENMQMLMASRYWGACSVSTVQGLYELGAFSVFVPGEEVPSWFNHRRDGPTVSLRVPATPPNLRLGGLNICAVYSFTYSEDDLSPSIKSQRYEKALNREYGYQAVKLEVAINRRKRLMRWSIAPKCFGVPKGHEHMMWFCHLNLMHPDQLEEGDRLRISVLGRGQYHVEECGVNFVYDSQDSFNSLIGEIDEGTSRADHSYFSDGWFKLGVRFDPCDPSDSEEMTDDDAGVDLDYRTTDCSDMDNHEDNNGIGAMESSNGRCYWPSFICACLACFFPSQAAADICK